MLWYVSLCVVHVLSLVEEQGRGWEKKERGGCVVAMGNACSCGQPQTYAHTCCGSGRRVHLARALSTMGGRGSREEEEEKKEGKPVVVCCV